MGVYVHPFWVIDTGSPLLIQDNSFAFVDRHTFFVNENLRLPALKCSVWDIIRVAKVECRQRVLWDEVAASICFELPTLRRFEMSVTAEVVFVIIHCLLHSFNVQCLGLVIVPASLLFRLFRTIEDSLKWESQNFI